MADVKATVFGYNLLNSLQNFKQRKMYQTAYPKTGGPRNPTPINFWDPKGIYYGRIDPQGYAMFANKKRMKTISAYREVTRIQSGDPLFVFDFVADAFEFFQKYMHHGPPARKITDSPWQKVKPYKAFASPLTDSYESYLNSVYDSYVRIHLRKFKNEKKILSPQDYVKTFFDEFAAKVGQDFPITYTGFVLSKNYNFMDSALCIELASGVNHAVDYPKFEMYVKNSSFDYFKYEAARHGFLVDKNAPWRLVANIKSPIMQQRMMKYGIASIEQFFSEYYTKTYLVDVEILKETLFASYLEYVGSYPVLVKPVLATCGVSNPETRNNFSMITRVSTKPREVVSREEFDKRVPQSFWLEKYVSARLREVNATFHEKKHAKVIKEIAKYNKYLDKQERVMHYINAYIKRFMVPPGQQSLTRLAGSTKAGIRQEVLDYMAASAAVGIDYAEHSQQLAAAAKQANAAPTVDGGTGTTDY